jgi:hypothetical protein
MTTERKDDAASSAREAAERRETGGASEPAGGSRDARDPRVATEPDEEVVRRTPGSVPEPEREEAPELLGERSDYPIPRGDDEPP